MAMKDKQNFCGIVDDEFLLKCYTITTLLFLFNFFHFIRQKHRHNTIQGFRDFCRNFISVKSTKYQ